MYTADGYRLYRSIPCTILQASMLCGEESCRTTNQVIIFFVFCKSVFFIKIVLIFQLWANETSIFKLFKCVHLILAKLSETLPAKWRRKPVPVLGSTRSRIFWSRLPSFKRKVTETETQSIEAIIIWWILMVFYLNMFPECPTIIVFCEIQEQRPRFLSAESMPQHHQRFQTWLKDSLNLIPLHHLHHACLISGWFNLFITISGFV